MYIVITRSDCQRDKERNDVLFCFYFISFIAFLFYYIFDVFPAENSPRKKLLRLSGLKIWANV